MRPFYPLRRSAGLHGIVATAALLSCIGAGTGIATAQQPAPQQISQMKAAANAAQETAWKEQYGLNDAQIARYRKKEFAIHRQHEARITALRKMMQGKGAAEKRRIVARMRSHGEERDRQLEKAMLSVATPAQQAKMRQSFGADSS